MVLPTSTILELWLFPPAVEQMPHVASLMIADGQESPALVECAAMYVMDHPGDVRTTFEVALVELGSPWTTRDEAAIHVIRREARRLTEGGADSAEVWEVISEVLPLYKEDDYRHRHPPGTCTPEMRFWHECWMAGFGFDEGRLRTKAVEVIEQSRSVV